MSHTASQLAAEFEKIEREKQEKVNALRSKAEARLSEIENERIKLDQEEISIRNFLNLPSKGEKARRKGTRAPSKRVSSSAKSETLAKFIAAGHITNGGKLTKELRTALKDAGFKAYDFTRIGSFLPAGWTAKSNGQRGLLAETIFNRS